VFGVVPAFGLDFVVHEFLEGELAGVLLLLDLFVQEVDGFDLFDYAADVVFIYGGEGCDLFGQVAFEVDVKDGLHVGLHQVGHLLVRYQGLALFE
jgi:hypothetical protein